MFIEIDKLDWSTDKISSWLSGELSTLTNFVLPSNIFYYSEQDAQKMVTDQLDTEDLAGFHFLPNSRSSDQLPNEVHIIISIKKI